MDGIGDGQSFDKKQLVNRNPGYSAGNKQGDVFSPEFSDGPFPNVHDPQQRGGDQHPYHVKSEWFEQSRCYILYHAEINPENKVGGEDGNMCF